MSSGESSSGSSQCSSSYEDENICFDFAFDLKDYVQEVVRLGALGIFQEARYLAQGALREHDYVFPVAIEIMRLMYDQGDADALYAYSGGLMAEGDTRTQHESWTAEALYILRLLHDACGALRGHPTNVPVTRLDLTDIESFEDLDDEQVRGRAQGSVGE